MHLLIACAGSGRRMGAERNKLLLEVAGRPVLAWTLEAALASASIRWIGIVGQPIDQADILAMVEAANPQKPVAWIQGGDTRQDSVCNGLAALPADARSVLIQDTPDRSHLWGAQTPQGFPVEQLRQAHARARAEGWSVTDDASLFERLGWAVSVMESSPANIKITTPFDLTIAEAVLAAR
jgi:2-C-methyl-D-erythritol 4-phosphate cytidylyltransferase